LLSVAVLEVEDDFDDCFGGVGLVYIWRFNWFKILPAKTEEKKQGYTLNIWSSILQE
jgi:hypothetical protein